MKEIILITGNNGMLAKEAIKILSSNYEVRTLTTQKKKVNNKSIFYWDISKKLLDPKALKNCKHIIHLAGYSILKRWTTKNKNKMYESRIKGAELLFNKCRELNIKPKTFISASAMGIYGLKAKGEKNENSNIGTDWVAQMAKDWENAANAFKKLESRVVKMRISLLLSKKFPLIKYNLLSTKLGVAPIIGSKKNIINWIHLKDAARFIQEAIQEEKYEGSYNLATENSVSQYELINIIKKQACPFAVIITIPNFLLKLVLGEREAILNVKLKLVVDKLINTGFKYNYHTLEEVIE